VIAGILLSAFLVLCVLSVAGIIIHHDITEMRNRRQWRRDQERKRQAINPLIFGAVEPETWYYYE
jgi:hypothetical protein